MGIVYAREVGFEPGPRRRVSHDLEQCGGGYLLSLEDDAPLQGERATFLVNITDPCWIWRGADLTKIKSIRATVGQIPFNFQIGKDAAKIPLHAPKTRDGELEIRLDDCNSAPVATRVAQASAVQSRPHAAAADPDRQDRRTRTTSASGSRAPGSIPSGPSAASSSWNNDAVSIILAPFAGWCAPLDEVPDAAFAKAMLGEGVAIDPTGAELRAPCDGEIISVAAARHAVALRSPAGAEVLIHVGIDTVALGGEGFQVHVRKGDRVRAGDLLLARSISTAWRAPRPSLMTPIIITNGERFRIRNASLNRVLACGDALFELEEVAADARGEPAGGAPVVSEALVVAHAHGIHARPAALIARIAKSCPMRSRSARADAARGRAAPWR